MAVLIPTSSPFVFTKAPPEFPGFTAASVWIKDSIGTLVLRVRSESRLMFRAFALTIPAVTVEVKLNGFLETGFIKKGLKHKISDRPIKKNLLDHLQSVFDKGVEAAFRNPKTIMGLGVLSVVAALFIATKVDSEFFPLSERNQFNMEVWMPNGSSLEKTEEKK